MADKVFCKDCRHFVFDFWHSIPSRCVATKKLHPVYGEVVDAVKCVERNKDMDCGLFDAGVSPQNAQARLESEQVFGRLKAGLGR